MKHSEKWIWLPRQAFPDHQTTVYSGLSEQVKGSAYAVAELQRTYTYEQPIRSAELRFSGDTVFQLFGNGELIATGPACVGGDFIGNDTPRDNFYSFVKEIQPDARELTLFARVQMMPTQICNYSKGHGGFMLFGVLTLEDGTKEIITTDESWLVRKNHAYAAPRWYDGTLGQSEWMHAEAVENIWNTATAPIPPRTEREIVPVGGTVSLSPHEEKEITLELDKIYAGFVRVRARTKGVLTVAVQCRELGEKRNPEQMIFGQDGEYRSFLLQSAGNLLVTLKNESDQSSEVTISFLTTHYPVYETADTRTSDTELNQVLEVCKHTLQYCRQTHHLDSPRHCEPLACTGDYYIEAMMTPFSFGDMRLAEFDLLRTAEMLHRHDGRMFHTTYSLIWVRMLYDVYMATGNRDLLVQCEHALLLLLRRFDSYVGDNGLIETPPDYMFVDWIYIDGLSMHHPPKALGQTCLNLFYFGALDTARKIFYALGSSAMAERCVTKREALRCAINEQLFDREKGIYFEGLNTPTEESLLGKWMPQNTEKRYYLKHSNILAAYVGVCDDACAKRLIEKIMSDEIEGEYQPYFAHYLLEAVYRNGLRDRYTRAILERWKAPVAECSKGLVEGFVVPEPTYRFDHSHAWGGTPLYSLPKALMGLEILSPGMRELRISPSLLGLSQATVELLTPYGKVRCSLREGEAPRVEAPKEMTVFLQY